MDVFRDVNTRRLPGGPVSHKLIYTRLRRSSMRKEHALTAIALLIAAASPAAGQVVSGVMTVTGAEMH